MKRILVAICTAALLPLLPTPATAAGADVPTWAAETGLPAGFTWGNWLPCRSDYQMTDCIESVNWLKSDGDTVAGVPMTSPNFNFATFKQTWAKESNGDTAQYFLTGAPEVITYTFDGMVNPCNNNKITFDVRAARYGFQINAQSTCGQFFPSKFEERFEITVRSRFLKGNAGSISSNGKNPGIEYVESGSDQLLTIKANFAYIAWNNIQVAGQYVNVCEQNEYRAVSGGWGLWNNIAWIQRRNDSWLAEHPGDMITGTNGWNCGGTMTWDPTVQGLVMQVGSPHYDPNGDVIDGWFEGAIRGRYITARFGIKPQAAAGSARLEITYNDGQSKVATIVATYDAVNDWVYLKGYGFTYSNPKLIVKFEKSKVEVPAPSPSPTPSVTSIAKAKSTISCVKGKTVRRVTGINPTCPAGYKKR